jgi:hypothetical protein
MSALDFGLGLAGLPEKTIKDLDTSLPALERIAAAAKQAEPLLTQLMPILNKAWPDIVAVTPLVQELIAFAKQKETE